MKRHLASFVVFALVLASCGGGGGTPAPAPTKTGATAIGPGIFFQVPVGFDPTASGYPGAVGNIIQNADGLGAWIKGGSDAKAWSALPTGNVTAQTPILDLTVIQTGISFVPKLTMPGYYFVLTGGAMVFTSFAGTATSSATWAVGNDGTTYTNVVSTVTMTSSNVNIFAPFSPIDASNTGPGNASTLVDTAAEIKFKSGAVTGATTFKGRYVVNGFWVPTT